MVHAYINDIFNLFNQLNALLQVKCITLFVMCDEEEGFKNIIFSLEEYFERRKYVNVSFSG